MFSIVQNVYTNVKFDYKKASIDNWIFKLHYRITFLFLVIAASFVYTHNMFGGKISCAHSDSEEDSNKKIKDAIDKYCFFMSLFTVPRHYNKSINDLEAAHPGVGPYQEDEEKINLLWYQWVPYVLFLQGVFFYVPHYIWRYWENKRLKKVLQHLDNLKLQDYTDETKLEACFSQAFTAINDRVAINKDWHIKLIFCEILNLVNVLLQMALTDWFLGGRFWTLGARFYQSYGLADYSYLDVVFPKVAKCTMRRFGAGGSIQTHDLLCVLALNVVNEKTFLVLWYWYIILATLSALMLVHRLICYLLYSTKVRYNSQLLTHRMVVRPKLQDVAWLVEQLTYGEWLYLNYLVSNLDPLIASAMIQKLIEEKKGSTFGRFPKETLINYNFMPPEEPPRKFEYLL